MFKRPLECWWIAAFLFLRSIATIDHALAFDGANSSLMLLYGAGLSATAGLILWYAPLGRILGIGFLGAEIVYHLQRAFPYSSLAPVVVALAVGAFSIWMIGYLVSASTRQLFKRRHELSAPGWLSFGMTLLDLAELGFAAIVTFLLVQAGLQFIWAGASGVAILVLYGLTGQDIIRRRWAELFMPGPVGLERGDTLIWKRACQAMDRGDVLAARHELSLMEPASRCSPDVALLEALLNWNDLLASSPTQGNAALYRAAMDFYWRPSDDMARKLNDAAAKISDADLGDLIEGRTEIINNLVKSVLNPASPFHPQAASILSRITGLKFSFNTEQNWLDWWENARPHWNGDAGRVSLVARLIRVAPDASAVLAKRICGRAEEPLLKTLTEQVVYLTGLQRAMQSREGVDAFIRQPRRLLLVPELADAVGLLHTDSPSLENLGLGLPAAMRQLKLRSRLIDYIASLWSRYPAELDEDMPWLLKTLTGRSLGGRRPRANFESWWPGARESVALHDRELARGLVAHHEHRREDEEKAFRKALDHAPRELTSRYNLALCLEHRKDFDGAKKLLKELTQLEPKEPFWWIQLGAIHRTIKQSDDALAAFRKAQQLGAAAPRVALQMGLTFAHDKRNDEAIQHIARWLGKNPPQSKIEALISALEDEGLWALAGHYREQAFRKGLSDPDDDLETGEEQTA